MPSSVSWILPPHSPYFLLSPKIHCADEKESPLGVCKLAWLTVRFHFLGEGKEETEVQCDSSRNNFVEDRKELSCLPKHACIKGL